MSIAELPALAQDIIYPESDGQPMADNTRQFEWIVTLKGGLDALFQAQADVFVAGDLLWYAVEGQPEQCRAPDAMIVFGRPKGHRGSYRQWEEDNLPPQVVFEVRSPSNTMTELARKFEFYDLHGVEEYYLYDPDDGELLGWQRQGGRLRVIEHVDGWISPHLGIRFDLTSGELQLIRPDGERFLTYLELVQQRDQERAARRQAERQTEQLAAKLQELGIDSASLLQSE